MTHSIPILVCLFVLTLSGAISHAANETEPSFGGVDRKLVIESASVVGEHAGAPLYATTIYSEVFEIDRILKSMEGPSSMDEARLWDEPGPPELLWVTGYSAIMVGPDPSDEVSPEFMCHSTMNVTDGVAYQKRFPSRLGLMGARLFTVDQGTPPVNLPDGFGIPIMSDQILLLNSQVLNHNIKADPFEVRQKIRIEFIRDRDLAKPLIPLLQHGAWSSVLVEGRDGHYGVKEGETAHGPGCAMGDNTGLDEYVVDDGAGRKFSAFWVVPPGRQENHTRITTLLDLPYSTTIHLATAHLHPFAESLELRDITTGESVLIAKATQAEKGVGLANVSQIVSTDGIPIYRDHEYELVSIYNNTSDVDQDAMATMFLYLRANDLYDFDFRPSK